MDAGRAADGPLPEPSECGAPTCPTSAMSGIVTNPLSTATTPIVRRRSDTAVSCNVAVWSDTAMSDIVIARSASGPMRRATSARLSRQKKSSASSSDTTRWRQPVMP
jgi:hypothetical protein